MANKSRLYKIMTGAVAFSLMTGGVLPVLSTGVQVVQAAESGITPFTDVPAGLYAEKHIYRLSLQQIVKGYENKNSGEFTFRYNNTISQQEAVIMAIRFAGLEDKLDTSGIFIFQEGFYVKEDYKPYIELAFKEGLLDRNEEYAIAAAEPSVEWGNKPASRQWVTKLIINAIGAEKKAIELGSTPSNFTDNSKIDSKYLGYVNAAVELELVKGYTETTFAPETSINRASFATILSRAQKDFPIDVEGQVYGVVTNITNDIITIYENGAEKNYSIDKSTGFYSSDSDFAITKDKIKLYTDISLLHINGQAKFVEKLSDEQQIIEVVGPVGRVNTDANILYVWMDNSPLTVPYHKDVTVVDSTGKKLTINDLKENSNVRITFDTFRTSQQVISIELITAGEAAQSTISGTFVSYVEANKMITIKTDKGLVSKYVAKNPTLSIPFIKYATIDDLIANSDVVTLTMDAKDEVIGIVIPEQDYKLMYLPTIVNYDSAKDLITVLDATGVKADVLFLSDNTRYLLNGSLVDEKFIDDPLEWNGLIIRYIEKNGAKHIAYFDLISEISGIVEDFNYFDEQVMLTLADGTITTLDYHMAGIESLSKDDYKILDIKKGQLLTVDFDSTDGSISTFRLHENHQMAVTAVSNSTKQITFKQDNKTYSVLYDEAEFVDPNGKIVNFADIKSGKTVMVEFRGKQIAKVIVL